MYRDMKIGLSASCRADVSDIRVEFYVIIETN